MSSKRFPLQSYIDGIAAGDRVMLAQSLSLVESSLNSDRALADQLLRSCVPHSGNSYRIGISGPPGVGKSSFIDIFGSMLTQQGHQLAVLAIDPSSSLSRGSILGDKTRMHRLSHDPKVFIRPSAAGQTLGGIAACTREQMLLCEAAGFDVVIIETVGVGQSEIAVRNLVDAFLLLLLPHAGDTLQGIKKGVMEMADILAIHKADGDYVPYARKAKAAISQALRLFSHRESGWQVPVLLTSVVAEGGLGEVWPTLERFRLHQQRGAWWDNRRKEQALHGFDEQVYRRWQALLEDWPEIHSLKDSLAAEVSQGKRTPAEAASTLIGRWKEIFSK